MINDFAEGDVIQGVRTSPLRGCVSLSFLLVDPQMTPENYQHIGGSNKTMLCAFVYSISYALNMTISGLPIEPTKRMLMNIQSTMKLIFIVFLLLLPTYAQALTPDQVFEKVKDSIVVVMALDVKGKLKGQGSGVLLPSGQIATNCHVTKEGPLYQVVQGKQVTSATLYAEDRDKDICLLEAQGFTGKSVRLGTSTDLKVGVPVYAVGAPQGLELSLSNGIVSQLRGGPPPLIQTTAAISPGSSGGGLFDEEGRLIGLTTLYLKEGQNLNFAMPVESIGNIKLGQKKVKFVPVQTEWEKRAVALDESKDWRGLLGWCRKWVKSEPKSAYAWSWIGATYHKLQLHGDAINACHQALLVNPEYADTWGNPDSTYGKQQPYMDSYRRKLKSQSRLCRRLELFQGQVQ